MTRVQAAWGRVRHRLSAGAQTEAPAAGGMNAIEADDAAHLFAGTDLPAREVLWALDEKVISPTLRGRPDGLDVTDLHGMVLAAFFLGWEARS